jgi:hypothetical protein
MGRLLPKRARSSASQWFFGTNPSPNPSLKLTEAQKRTKNRILDSIGPIAHLTTEQSDTITFPSGSVIKIKPNGFPVAQGREAVRFLPEISTGGRKANADE